VSAGEIAAGRLAGRLALVTGAARGIGLGVATSLAEDGAKVVLSDIDGEVLERAAAALRERGLDAVAIVADVSDPDSIAALFDRAREHGRVEILVNNAGRIVVKPFLEESWEDWTSVIATNLSATFLTCRRAIPEMIEVGRGAIVNVSSLAGFHYTVPHTAYSASKAGLVAVTRELAYQFGPQGIRVNAISPGAIATRMTGAEDEGRLVDPAVEAKVLGAVQLGRWGQPEDVGKLVAFLASDDAGFITGDVVTIAGGSDLRIFPDN
jgi:NAD(P)-dependent dehydrogenase (short-subunit alcohol dehydrogenase family)